MTPTPTHRIPQGLSPCGRYRAILARYGGGIWLVFDTHAPFTREPRPLTSYRDVPGATAELVLAVFAQERASVPAGGGHG